MNIIVINSSAEKKISRGHMWVFVNDCNSLPKINAGSIVNVFGESGESYGPAFYNRNSQIALRLLNTLDGIDKNFFFDRISFALEHRQNIFPSEESYRIVNAESDFLPGLVIDKFADYLSIQFLSPGMERFKDIILDSLLELLPETKGILENNTSHLRRLEGLEENQTTIWGEIPEEIQIVENEIKLNIDLFAKQDILYRLDQKTNRKACMKLSNNKRVLDCFSNHASFALHCAKSGARDILAVNNSKELCEKSIENAKLNDFQSFETKCVDAIEFLDEEIKNEKTWDMIILNPPAFAKNKKSLANAKNSYQRINNQALHLIPEGGYLASSCSSQLISEDVFKNIIKDEAVNLGRHLRLVYTGSQSACHPILEAMPETKYLKFFIWQII